MKGDGEMKTLRVLVVEPNKVPMVEMIEDTLAAKQELVGGYIEMTTPPMHTDDAVIICNEEGKIQGLPFNRMLTLENGIPYDIIAGTFFVIRAPEDSEDFASLTDEQIETYSKMYA